MGKQTRECKKMCQCNFCQNDKCLWCIFAWCFQWKTKLIEKSPAVETAPAPGWRSLVKPALRSLITSWRSSSAASSVRSIWACRTGWSWQHLSTSLTHRSKHGTKTAGEYKYLVKHNSQVFFLFYSQRYRSILAVIMLWTEPF